MKNTIKFLEYCKMNHYGKLNHQYLRKVYKNGSSSPTTNDRYIYRGYLHLGALNMNNGADFYQALFWDPTEPQATRPLALLNNEGTYYYGHDFNKNVTELFNSNGDIVNHYDYRPYGALLESSESIPNPIQYSSEVYDPELGLISYNYRHYNPEDGRWLTRDPIQEDGGLNLCGFVGNNPLLWFDINGLWPTDQRPQKIDRIEPLELPPPETNLTPQANQKIAQCQEWLKRITEKDFYKKFLSRMKCQFKVGCVNCVNAQEVYGVAIPKVNGTIILLGASKHDTEGNLEGTLRHELTHAYDDCGATPPKTLEEAGDDLCLKEVRAYNYGQYPKDWATANKINSPKAKAAAIAVIKKKVKNISQNDSAKQLMIADVEKCADKAWNTFMTTPQINPFL